MGHSKRRSPRIKQASSTQITRWRRHNLLSSLTLKQILDPSHRQVQQGIIRKHLNRPCVIYMIRCRWGGPHGERMTKFGITQQPLSQRLKQHSQKNHYWRARLSGLWQIQGDAAARQQGIWETETKVKRELRRRNILQKRTVPGQNVQETELVCRQDEKTLVECLKSQMEL